MGSDPAARRAGPAANGLIGDAAPKTPPQRLPVPDGDAQAKAAKEVADIYAKDIKAANKSKEKAALAKQFVTVAAQTNDDPAGRYMLLEDARKMAIEAGAARMVCDAIDQMAKSYDVDRDALSLSSLDLTARTAASQDQSRELIRVALDRTDEALADNQFDLAMEFGEIARAAAAKLDDKPQLVSISQKLSAIQDTGKQYAPAQAAIKTLADTPDDPQANLTAGRFFCFVKGDWPTGLVYLAKSNDAVLAPLAQQDLQAPADAESQLKIADGWWDEGAKETGISQLNARLRAKEWYQQIIRGATGLTRLKIEKRLAELGDQSSPLEPQKPGGNNGARRRAGRRHV